MLRRFRYWLVAIAIIATTAAYGKEIPSDAEMLSDYVDWFHSCEGKCQMKPRYAKKAKELIPFLLKHSDHYEIDPLLAANITSFESSWRDFEGDKGEIGPMHVMPSKWSRQFDLTTLDGQIQAGCAHLRFSYDTCEVGSVTRTLERMFTHYACGSCVSTNKETIKAVQRRMRKYRRAKARYRPEPITQS